METKIYSTLELAEQAAKYQNKQPSVKFCPLINAICKKNCICYIPAQTITMPKVLPKERYRVSVGFCNNYMFNGE